jgi:hypothetical protein
MKLSEDRHHFVFEFLALPPEMGNSMIFGAKRNNVRRSILAFVR